MASYSKIGIKGQLYLQLWLQQSNDVTYCDRVTKKFNQGLEEIMW